MSLLSSFITNQLLKSLEEEFVAHAPELQDAFLSELSEATKLITNWVEAKIAPKPNA